MTVYKCLCGYESSAAPAFHKHLSSFKGKTREHYMITVGPDQLGGEVATAAPDAPAASATPTRPISASSDTPAQAAYSLSSLPARLGSLWSSPTGMPRQQEAPAAVLEGPKDSAREEEGRDTLSKSKPARDPVSSAVEASLARVSKSSEASASRQSDVDAAWETVAALAPSDEEEGGSYRAITRQLHALGGGGGGQEGPPSAPTAAAGGLLASPTSGLFTRTMDMFGWGTSGTAAAGGASARRTALPPPAQIPVERVEALLLWEEPYASAKVFGAGLYVLICLRHLVCGVEVLQPSSALAGGALFVLMYGALRRAWSARRDGPPTLLGQELPAAQDREAQLQARVEQQVHAAAKLVAPVLSALVALVMRRLSGRDSVGTRVWVGLLLWATMCVGELRLVSQSVLAMYLWIALFTLPYLYRACRHALDSLVEETLLFIAEVLRGGERTTLGLAGGVGVLLLAAVDASVFARISVAAASSGGVLIWRARRLRAQAQSSLQSYPIAVAD